MNTKFFIIGGVSVITLFIITLFAIADYSYDYIQTNRAVNKYNTIINEKDSCIYELNEKLLIQNIEVENYKDSINSLINELDSINEELQINKIKIERIREYNRIAAQGNNIKFLRGWINRVIN